MRSAGPEPVYPAGWCRAKPYYGPVEVLVGLLGLVVGVLVGIGVTRWPARSQARKPAASDASVAPPLVAPAVVSVVQALRAPAMLVGPYDEVMHSTSRARTVNMARGTRVSLPEVLDMVRRSRASGRPESCELRVRPVADAPIRELTVRTVPLANGVVLVLAEDHSAIARANEVRRDFVANVSHELKTPVGALQVLSEAVEQAADDPEAVRHFADRMSRESARLSDLVRQLIDLSRLQSDDPMLAAEPVQVDGVVLEAVSRNRERAEERAVDLTVVGTPGLAVLGDAEQLVSAVVNLVQNAIAYSDKGARVSVSTRELVEADDSYVDIAVTDNGIGIRPEDQERIFERFYRVDYARSRESGGTGLGLSIVKHIAIAHGGSVSVWSKVGQGSTFTIRLPSYLPEDGRPDDGTSVVGTQPGSEVLAAAAMDRVGEER